MDSAWLLSSTDRTRPELLKQAMQKPPQNDKTKVAGLSLLVGLLIFACSVALAFYAASVQSQPLSAIGLESFGIAGTWLPVMLFTAALALITVFAALTRRHHNNAEKNRLNRSNNFQFAQSLTGHHDNWAEFEQIGEEPLEYPEFCQALQRHWENCRRQSSYLALALFEIDDFCVMSDAFCHQDLDRRISEMTLSLNSLVRAEGGLLSRPKERQFLALFPNKSPDSALQITQDMQLSVEDLGFERPAPSTGVMTVSAGLYIVLPIGSLDRELLLSAASRNLELARKRGRNHIETEMLDSELALRA